MASYSAVIDVRVNGLDGIKTVENRLNAIKNIQKQLKPIPNLFDKRASAEIKAVKKELSEYVISVGKGNEGSRAFSGTLAGLNSQIRAFNAIAANATAGSDEFTGALQASERASVKLKNAEISRLRVLNQFYTPKTVGGSVNVKEILDLGKTIPKSVSGLEFYQRELQETLRLVTIGSKDFTDLSLAIADVNEQLARVSSTGRIQGPQPLSAEGFPRSPLGRRSGTQRSIGGRSNIFSNVAAGVGFPLLFGGGLGSIVGGGLGALGGFGGSVLGSAIGQLLDGVAESIATLGKALNPLTADINALTKAAGQSDTALGKLLEAYKDQDKAAEVLSATVGQKGVRDLREYGAATAKLAQEFAKLGSQLQASLAPILIDITNFLTSQARKTRLDQQVFQNTFTGVELRAGFENEPALVKAIEKFRSGLISEKDLLILGRRIALQREYTKELQVETDLRTKAVNESARAVQIERSRLAVFLLSNKAFSEATFELKEQIALQEKELRDEEIRKEARTDEVKAARLRNDLASSQIQYESRLAQISREKTAAEIQGIKERYTLTQRLFDLEEQNINASLRRIRDLGDVIARVNNALTAQKAAEMSRSEAELETSLVGGRDIDNIARQQAAITEELRKRLGYEVEIGGEKKRVLGLLDIEQRAALMSGVRSQEEIDAIDARFSSLRRVASFEAETRYSILEIRKQELIAQEQLEKSQRRAAFVAEKSALEARIESPFGGNKLEQDLLGIEQLQRRSTELGQLQADIDAKANAADKLRAANYVEKAHRLDEETNRLRAKLELREQELTQIEELEMAELKLAQTVQDVYAFVGPAVSSLTSGLLEVIDGTKSAEEAFADFLRNISDMLMQTATQMIAQYIALGIARSFGLGGQTTSVSSFANVLGQLAGRANGGPVSTGTPYMVGERGPELFVPKSSGTIVPNHALGGGGVKVETINITVENTGESLSPKAQKQIAGQVQGIVLSTLANERRSGGML